MKRGNVVFTLKKDLISKFEQVFMGTAEIGC